MPDAICTDSPWYTWTPVLISCGVMWVGKSHALYELMAEYLGQEKADNGFQVKDFFDQGVVAVTYSDYPAAETFGAPSNIRILTESAGSSPHP